MDVRTRRAVPVLLLVALLALAGCTNSSGNDSSSSSAEGVSNAQEGRPAAPAATPGTATSLGVPGRAVVYTGEMSLTTRDVSGVAGRVIAAVTASGGYVANDERSAGDRPTARLTLKVPSPKFTRTVDAVARLGTEASRKLGTDDRQVATIDLDSQIASQRASVNRIRALLNRASSLDDLSRIESELTTRESALATSEANRRTLADEVSYSTLAVNLAMPTGVVKPKPRTQPERGLLVGLRHGWHAFVVTLRAVLTVVGALLPFAVLAALVGAPVWWYLRRRRAAA
jgi:hypothetical protein